MSDNDLRAELLARRPPISREDVGAWMLGDLGSIQARFRLDALRRDYEETQRARKERTLERWALVRSYAKLPALVLWWKHTTNENLLECILTD